MLLKSMENDKKSSFEKDRLGLQQIPYRMFAKYMLMGVLWILILEKVLFMFVSSRATLVNISMIKEWLYVLLTCLLIYILVSLAIKRIKVAEDSLYTSYLKYIEYRGL